MEIILEELLVGEAPSPEYTLSGDYRSSAAGGSAKGPSSRLTIAGMVNSGWMTLQEVLRRLE